MGMIGEIKTAASEAAKTLEVVQGEMSKLSPQAQQALGKTLELLGGLKELTDTITDTTKDIHEIVEGLESAPAWAQGIVGLVHRLGERAGKTLQGLFPLRISAKPSQQDSMLGTLLRGPDGKPGSLEIVITPNIIPK